MCIRDRYFAEHFRSAWQWIRREPKHFAYLTVRRIKDFWLPPSYRQETYARSIALITALSVPGFVLAWKTCRSSSVLLGSISLAYPLVYYVIQSSLHYRIPIMWTSILLAGYGIDHLIVAASRRKSLGTRPGALLTQ